MMHNSSFAKLDVYFQYDNKAHKTSNLCPFLSQHEEFLNGLKNLIVTNMFWLSGLSL